MVQIHRVWQIPRGVLACVGLALIGCGIVASNALFGTIPVWFARPALILLVGVGAEIMAISLIDRYTGLDP
jgi:hypothetical protein